MHLLVEQLHHLWRECRHKVGPTLRAVVIAARTRQPCRAALDLCDGQTHQAKSSVNENGLWALIMHVCGHTSRKSRARPSEPTQSALKSSMRTTSVGFFSIRSIQARAWSRHKLRWYLDATHHTNRRNIPTAQSRYQVSPKEGKQARKKERASCM
jgi:hypothetical protein